MGECHCKNKLNKRGIILFVLMLIVGLASLDKYLIGFTIKSLAVDYLLSASDLSLILSSFQIGFIISTVGGGFFVDKYGYKHFMIASFTLLAAVSYVFGFVQSLFLIVLLRFMAGLGAAGFVVAVPKAISSLFNAQEAPDVQAKATPACGVAGIVTAIMGQMLLAETLSVKFEYILMGVMFTILVICIYLYIPDKSAHKAGTIEFRSLVSAYKNKAICLLALIYALFNLATIAMLNWLPLAFSQFPQSTPTIVGAVMFGFYILETLVLASTGPVIKKWFATNTPVLLTICAIGSAISLVSFGMSQTITMGVLTIYAATVFIILGCGVLVVLPYRYVSTEIMGSSFAAVNLGGRIGGILAPFVATLFMDASGIINFSAAFVAYAVLVAFSVVLIKRLPPAIS